MKPFEFNKPEDTNTFTSRRELGWSLSNPPKRMQFSLFKNQPRKYTLPDETDRSARNAFFRKAAALLVGLAAGSYLVYGVMRPHAENTVAKPQATVVAPK